MAVAEWISLWSVNMRVICSNPTLEGSQCHPPPQVGACSGRRVDIPITHGWSCIE